MSRIYYLNVKSFNKSIDVSKLLPGLDTNWECCVHSYYIVINGERQKVLRMNCNLVEFDRVLRKPHLLEIISNREGLSTVEILRWKRILITATTDFRLLITNLTNSPVNNISEKDSHVLLAFRARL